MSDRRSVLDVLDAPSASDVAALDPREVRAALLARGIGLTEAEVTKALEQLKSSGLRTVQDAVPSPRASSQRLQLDAADAPLRAGVAAGAPAVEFAVAWFIEQLFVPR
jgi:hypothetical protein